MKVLITGASGFVGNHLIDYIKSVNLYEIYGTFRNNKPKNNLENINFLNVDLLKKDEVFSIIQNVKPDFVFHLAANAHVGESFNNPLETIMNNVSGELNILDALKSLNLQKTKTLIVSTAEVYGMVNESDLPMDEDTPHRPANPYAVSKITQDYLGLQYSIAFDLDIIRVRPFNHIGPGQSEKFVTSKFAKQIAEIEKGKRDPILKVGNLESKRDFTDVRDIVKGYHLLIQKGVKSEVYNIGSGKSHSIKDILNMLLSLTDISIQIEHDETLMRPSDTPEIRADCTKLMNLTGWKPEIELETTLKDTLEYWRSVI